MKFKGKPNILYVQLGAIGFLAIIIIGAILLSLPVSSRDGLGTPLIDALFTSTSATCVTGLIVYDTYNHFSTFGQIVIITLIQIGGLGFMMIGTMFMLVLRKKIGIRSRSLLKDSISTGYIGGIVRLARNIIIGTLLFEGIGALILSIRFSFEMNTSTAIFNGIFHSISAFCNAGFDIMGRNGEFTSLTGYVNDIAVNCVIMSLIVIGGIGFVVWEDIYVKKFNFSKYKLHSKIVLTVTLFLIMISAVMFYFFERKNLMAGLGFKGSLLASLFQAVTPRTAGFNTTDTASLSEGSKLLTMILMVIGGSPGSTAGGIKTTTFVISLLTVVSSVKRSKDLDIFNRRLEDSILIRAYSIVAIYLMGATLSTLMISFLQPELVLGDIAFEVFSAIGTVGMSTGITSKLCIISKSIIILLMYCGRVGSLSVLLAVTENKNNGLIKNPVEKVIIG
ncbi:MAG: TrkH family potassium uptake protein [Natronincolaceae bacterium]|nr:TrkH family potassium uptake protein [Bacillota bacterium]